MVQAWNTFRNLGFADWFLGELLEIGTCSIWQWHAYQYPRVESLECVSAQICVLRVFALTPPFCSGQTAPAISGDWLFSSVHLQIICNAMLEICLCDVVSAGVPGKSGSRTNNCQPYGTQSYWRARHISMDATAENDDYLNCPQNWMKNTQAKEHIFQHCLAHTMRSRPFENNRIPILVENVAYKSCGHFCWL